MTEEVRNVGDETQVKARKKTAKLHREKEVEELREVLSTSGGRATIYRILEWCQIYQDPCTHPQAAFRDIGKQDVGRLLLREVFTSDQDAYTVMLREAKERDNHA